MRIIEVGDDYDRALISGYIARDETQQRMQQERSSFRERVGRYRGEEYLSRFEDYSRSLDIDQLARRAISIGRQVQSAFRDDLIYDMHEMGDFQHASLRIQNYILSDPRVNYLARNQRMEAWNRTLEEYAYTDQSTMRENPYYRAMNNGYLRVSERDERDMTAVSYLGQGEDEMERLSHDEKMSLHRSVGLIMDLLGNLGGDDPTSPSNNSL